MVRKLLLLLYGEMQEFYINSGVVQVGIVVSLGFSVTLMG